MARSLSDVVDSMFSCGRYHTRLSYYGNCSDLCPTNYMEIPISADTFEVPLFAMKTFMELVDKGDDYRIDTIVAGLTTYEFESTYKSLERNMHDVLVESFANSKLIVIKVPRGNTNVKYYGTYGAVFDDKYTPLMMCSWQMERVWQQEGPSKYRFVRPIVRVLPNVYVQKRDAMEKFLSGKFLNNCISIPFHFPYRPIDRFLDSNFVVTNVKAELYDIPFNIHIADTPSISTSNKQLLQLALDHIEEVIQ